MRLLLFAIILTFVVLGCSDGKLNLLLVFWGDSEESSSSSFERNHDEPEPPSSSAVILSSSSNSEPPPYSSGEEPPPLSSSEETPPLSSSSRGTRSSSSKEYVDYPTLEEGAKDVKIGWATRYWDGCKPHCSWLGNNIDTRNPKPWNGICKNCDKNNKEVTTYRRHPDWKDGLYYAGYLSKPSSCDTPGDTTAYACWDMAPIAINDTLAYGFAAMNPEIAECGTCYQLVFDGYWYDEPAMPRPTHRAIKGKTMIVMASNIGGDVKHNATMKDGRTGTQFDILIPGGGVGAFNSFSNQLGLTVQDMGVGFGGLLSNCIEGGLAAMGIRDGSHRATLEQWQECLKIECNRVFSGKAKELYNGCLWHSDWFMAADNPTLHYRKVDCPKYLVDKYYSSIDTEPPPLPDPYPLNELCMIEGIDCKQTGWY
jgi:hypothetical protein